MAFALRTGGKSKQHLVNHATDWGVSVSAARTEKTLSQKSLAAVSYAVIGLGAFLLIPILAGLTFFGVTREMFIEFGIIFAVIGLGRYVSLQASKGPKDALQIDYRAGEVRLGSINSAGAFMRQKVFSFRTIHSAGVDTSEPRAPKLTLETFNETATIRFADAEPDALRDLARQIEAAAQAARAAPVRSRIVSRINGIEAGVREIGHRVRSRITSFA